MIKDPPIKNGQFAVLAVDGATGHVLDIDGNLFRNDVPKDTFFVFADLISARNFIQKRQVENDSLEFVIYDHNLVTVEVLGAPKWKSE